MRRLIFFLTCMVTPAASLTEATTFIMKSEDEKISEADWICAVKVISVSTFRPQKYVLSRAEVTPLQCFKGGDSKNFSVIWPGGTFKDEKTQTSMTTQVPGSLHLTAGETAVLYLMKSDLGDRVFSVHSLVNGVMNLDYDAKSKQYLIRSGRIAETDVGSHSQTNFPSTQKRDLRSLKSFGEKVQEVLRRPR